MAIDGFIKFDQPGNGATPIMGESQDQDYPGSSGWSGVQNVTFGSENVGNVATNTGGSGSGKLSFKEFAITKHVDSASPPFFTTLCAGGHYGTVTLLCRKTTGASKPQPFLKYYFAEVKVLGIDVTLSESDSAPSESVKFSYAAMKMEYSPQLATGALGAVKVAQWSQTKNTSVFAA